MDKKKSTKVGGAIGGQKIKHTSSSFKDTHAEALTTACVEHQHNVPAKRRIVQNFLLIWLDTNIDKSSSSFRHSMAQLCRSVNTIDIFTDPNRCVDYLTRIKNEKALMIVSGTLGPQIVPLIHDMSQLAAVFVFCGNRSRHEWWIKQWSKVKGIFTDIVSICDSLKLAVRQCDHDTISISFFSTGDACNANLDQLDQSFMCIQILKESLFEFYCDEQSIKDFTTYCRLQYAENESELAKIDKFERQYGRKKSPIWWYTYDCFLYQMLNRALRNQEVDTIIKMGFFIRDLHQQIAELHVQQFEGQQIQPFTVYRVQNLSIGDFEKLTKTKSGLMSFNNFLSTSKDLEVILGCATRTATDPEQLRILFKMTIDPSISKTSFAGIDHISHYQSEGEVLFSLYTVFRIVDLQKLNNSNQLWQVELKLISDNDPVLGSLTKRIREETQWTSGWDRLGQLLIRLNQFDKGQEVYQVLLNQTSTVYSEKAHYYNQLGLMKNKQEEYADAILYNKKAFEILQKTLPPNHHLLSTSYNNIGLVYANMGEYSKALSSHEKALETDEKILPPNHPDLAASYNTIGNVYINMDEYSKALLCYEKALQIYQNTFPANHPVLATPYSNLGLVYNNMGEYLKAISFYEKALEIDQKVLPPNHLDLATSYNNIAAVYKNVGEFSKALSFYEKALEILQKSLPPNHPSLATSYGLIGLVYSNMGDYVTALSFYEKVFEIKQKTLSPDDLSLATSYNTIGSVYSNMGQYLEALFFYEKALEIKQKALSSNHPDLATSYNRIGLVYSNMGEYLKALSSHGKALEIRQKALPPNHSDFATYYRSIGSVYDCMGEYSRALSSHEKALKIKRKPLHPKNPDLTTLYGSIGGVYYNIEEYSKALSFYERAFDIWQNSLPSNHLNLQALHKNMTIVKKKT